MKYKVMENVSVRKGAILMKRMLSIILIAAMVLTVVAIPQTSTGDARGIKVIPYPKTAGQMASYKISFNVTRPLSANQDSITVTLPKETVVPDYISSSVISINPKKLIGTDYRLNFATGGITFTNPLREGDMIKASYTYEASEEYTFMPKASDVKFFDRSFAAGDQRNNNGQFDPGEWVYEDRDHNGRISPGDRRLTVIKGVLGGNDAKQNSIVSAGDVDCPDVAGGTGVWTNPLTPLSIIKLTMLDVNNDGIYNDGDYLFDDRDQSGTVTIGDTVITGIITIPAGSTVASNDPDYNTRIAGYTITSFTASTPVTRHTDDGSNIGSYDSGELIYLDQGSTGTVDTGDTRLTSVTVRRNNVVFFYPAGTIVGSTAGVQDADVGTRLIDFKSNTGEEEGYLSNGFVGNYMPGDIIYRNTTGRSGFFTSSPQPGDTRVSTLSISAYEAGSQVVNPNDSDLNDVLVGFNKNPMSIPECWVGTPNPAPPSSFPILNAVNPSFDNYCGASIAPTGASTLSTQFLTALPPVPDNYRPLGTWLYRDMDKSGSVTPGDVRLSDVVVRQGSVNIKYSAGSIVRDNEFDIIDKDKSILLPLVELESGPGYIIRHTENIKVNNMYDPGELIYDDVDANGLVSGGDYRLVPVGVTSIGNKAIQSGSPLIGKTLTRGWARIENKVIVPYAQAGTKTASLETTPITVLPTLIPPTPPTNLRADFLTLPGGQTPLTYSGKWYIKVSAVNMFGEGEPSEPMEINFAQNSTVNAVKLSWRPIPFAVSYRIYKSKNDAYFPPSSLLAEVEGPCCEYLDKGTPISDGTLAFPYNASFVTLWRTRGGMETQLVEYNCADYEMDLPSGMVRFRRALRPYEIVLADYKYAPSKTALGSDLDPCKTVAHKDEHVYVDTQRGIGKLLHYPAVDPKIDPLNYCFRLWRAPMIDPKNPYLLRESSDYTINYQTGEIVFSAHVVTEGDIITADYDTFEEVAGESLVEAISTGITQAQCSSPVIPESYTIYRAVALRSAPQIRITGGAYGWQIVFTTPVDVAVDPDNDPTTPDVIMTLNRPGRQFGASSKGAVRNPEKAGNYQLWVQTSQEQTPILSDPYEIIANKDLKSAKLNIISPQISPQLDTDPPCACKDALATAGQATSIVAQLMADSNGLPNTYVRFEIVSTVNPPSAFSSPNLVQTNDQGLASVVLNLSATAGVTVVKVYLQDDPSICRCININTGPAIAIGKIVVTPGPTVALTPNSQQLFTAQAFDAQGVVIPGVTFTWQADLGTINQNGLYTAPMDPGVTAHVYARASGKEGMSTVSIMTRPDRIQITPQSAVIATGSQQTFTAQAYDSMNNPMNAPITWTVEPGALGTFDANGVFTAGSIEGTGTVKACSAGMCGTATITVKRASDIDRIEIVPASVTMNIGGTTQFTAKAYDKNNYEIQGAPFTWSVNPPTSGTISSTGLFIAAQPGISVITVQSGTKFASAVANVVQVTRIDLTPAVVRLAQGTVQTFTAVAYTSTGSPVSNVTFTWEVQPPTLGTISNGTFIAIGTPGSTGAVIAKAFGLSGMAQVTIEAVDVTPPTITLVNPPANGTSVPTSMAYQIEIKASDTNGISEVTVNGIPATLNAAGNYVATIQINSGTNTIVIRAKDNSSGKNVIEQTLTIIGSCPRIFVVSVGSQQGTLTKNCGTASIVTLSAVTDIISNSTMVGFRDLGEQLFGGSVSYTQNANGSVKDVTIKFTKSNGDMVSITCVIGEKLAQITTLPANGGAPTDKVITMPSAPIVVSNTNKAGSNYKKNVGRTMIPMRTLVEEIFGKQIVVNGATVNTVNWTSNTQPITFTIIP